MGGNDVTVDIPLQTVVSHTPSARKEGYPESTQEKGGLFHRGTRGRRKIRDASASGPTTAKGGFEQEEQTTINRMGRIYYAILNFSIITRYFIYVLPVALCLAVPIIVGATVAPNAKIGKIKMVWVFTWIEIVWLTLWISKIIAHFLPALFQFFAGVVSTGIRKYAEVIRNLEIPLSLVIWAVVCLVTFRPITFNVPLNRHEYSGTIQDWQSIMLKILAALLVCSCVLLAEKFLIQLIGINYHRKQFDTKIKDSKRNIHLLGLLYDASRTLFPEYGPEFAEEDYIIQDSLQLTLGNKKGHKRSGSATPLRLLQDVGRIGDKITSAVGKYARELTGKQVFDPTSAHSIVTEALEKTRSSEALARRIWMSFVVEGKNALYQEDIIEVLGRERQEDAEECFTGLDRDGNGDISLDEMILTVAEFGRERKSITSSMHDVDQAIRVLDGLLATIVFLICIFIFIGFLNQSFVTTLATTGTAILSLSFVFAATCQEVLGSCIFLFVKHPYDIGDRVDLGKDDQLTVEHISLLFTVFKRVSTGKMVQIPNIVLNNLWVENVSRSKAMREQVSIFVAFDTTFEDVNSLKQEMQTFVVDKENSRDFQPDVDIEVVGIAELNKMELRIEIRHKSNWANETVRAARRSKFMCALVLALRKVPIYAPGGGDASLGDLGKPSYSVSISGEQAQANRDKYLADKEAKRLFPSKKPGDDASNNGTPGGQSTGVDYLGNVGLTAEGRAAGALNSRAPAVDLARDDTWNSRDDNSTLGRPSMDRSAEVDEVRTLLHKESSRGRRKQGLTPERSGSTSLAVPSSYQSAASEQQSAEYDYAQRQRLPSQQSDVSTGAYAQPPSHPPNLPLPTPGNAFAAQRAQQQQQQQQQGERQYRPYSGV